MTTTVSYTSYDYDSVRIVPVIASFNTEGRICPLYVKIDDRSYKIDSYTWNSRYGNITDFVCRIIDGDFHRPLRLSYHASEGMWTIPARPEPSTQV